MTFQSQERIDNFLARVMTFHFGDWMPYMSVALAIHLTHHGRLYYEAVPEMDAPPQDPVL